MKSIPQYSLVIFPSLEQSEQIKSYKQLLKSQIGWFGSANAAAHITVIQFNNEMELELYINQIREFCKTVEPRNVIFNTLGKFEEAGAFFIAPDASSKLYLNSIIMNMHEFLGFKIDAKNVNAHMSIARKLYAEKMKTAFEVFKDNNIHFEFLCDVLYVRKFNEQKQQYADIIEKIPFGN